ncbi:MAG: hypothetical protein M1816_007546 [Peltula sp. TS41687]|nr:MAG: hypothetical protein M1816_007546 [Peltula sp. TS41687]
MSDIVNEMSPEEKSNVARGLKASISNPHVSDETKADAKERLESMGDTKMPQGEKDPSRVVGGLKAAISNPGIGEEGTQKAQEKLDAMEKS